MSDMLSRPQDFNKQGIKDVYLCLKEKHYRDGYKDGATDTVKELLDILEKDIFFGDGIMCRLQNVIIKKMGIKLND